MEEIGKKKCPKCGGKYLPKTTANGIIYECESCGYKTIERIGKSFHADYRSRRRSVKLDIERIIDDKFTPTKCPCGTAASKLIEVASLNDGLSYKCPKCGNVQRDEGSKRCLDLLYELGHEFPDESGRDPVYHYLFIQVWTRNFQYWSEKVNQHLSMVEKSSYDKEDEEDVLAYGQSMNGLLFQHAIEIGDIKLCPYCKSNYIKKSAKMCEECEVKREEKQIEKEEKRELNRQYRDSEAGKASAKKKATAALVLLIVAILAATSVIAIYVVAPKLLFGSSTIEYYVDGTRYTAEAVYSKKVSIDKPTKTGHRFLGLYDAEIDGNMVIDPSGKSMTTWQSKEKDITVKLYPHWETIEYKIKLDVNGGIEGNLVTPNVVYGESMNALPVDVTREGYTFVGWATSADDDALLVSDKTGNLLSGKETLTDNGYVIPDEGDEITLYAKWTYYTVTTTANISEAGSVSKMNETKVTVGDNVTVMATTNIGYTWIGWYDGNTKLTDELTYTFEMTTKNKTLTAKWTKTEIVKSDNMAGSVSELSSTYKVGDSATVTASTNIGYTWIGWFDGYTKLTDELSYTFVMTEEDKTLTAKWIANTYNISYDVNGGSAMASSTDTIQFNSTKTLAVPTKAHYTFEGWYIGNTQITTGNGKMLRNWSIANNDTVLTAKWTAVTYTISFANCDTISPMKVQYNTTITLPTPTSQYKYDTFVSWSYGGNNYTDSFTMPGGNIVMTAQWDNNGWTYISTKDEFRNIANNMSGKYVILNDIDLGSWTPMGQYYCAKGDWNTVAPTLSGFSGKIDGQGKTISYNITITKAGNDYDHAWGIFGSVNNAEFIDLVVYAEIGGRPQEKAGGDSVAGAITGWAVNSRFDNCTSKGSIYQFETAGQCSRSGGLVGFAQGSTFVDCTNKATVYASDFNATAGGIVGGNGNGNTFNYCSNKGSVSANKGNWVFGKSGYGEIFGPLTL